jgi:hypothetical protein
VTEFPKSYEPLLLNFHPPREENGYVVIGDDEGSEIRLMPDGMISAVDDHGTLPTRFVNSSIEQLIRCIHAHEEYARNVAKVSDEESQLEEVAHFSRAIGGIDAKALCDPENWWSVIVEQMRDGML